MKPIITRFTVTIELGNEAMLTGCHVAKALADIAKSIADLDGEFAGPFQEPIYANGLPVGKWGIKKAWGK